MKKILSTVLLLSVLGLQIAPVEAAFRSSVSETRQAKKEAKAQKKAQEKADKNLYKTVKQKKDLN